MRQVGNPSNGLWQAAEDVQDVRVHVRVGNDAPGPACVRGCMNVLATPEELLDLILHQGDSHAQWDEIYLRGMVRDALAESVRALRIALKHTGNAAKRELHMLQTWTKLDDSCAPTHCSAKHFILLILPVC